LTAWRLKRSKIAIGNERLLLNRTWGSSVGVKALEFVSLLLERRSPRDYLRLSSMPRTANLRPGYRKARADKRLAAWVVNVPSELSSTGHRQELFFPTKGEAQAECEKLKARKDNFGISLSAMTPGRIAEASEAYKLLDPLNVSLLEACATMLPDISNETIACPLSICSIFF
jgi:hypothetical protein